MVKVVIVNVVATASLDQKLDLSSLSKFGEILYDPDVYGGRVAYFKTPSIEGRVSLFSSGKIISVGARNEPAAFNGLNCAMTFLAEKGLIKKVELRPLTQNIVATADFEESVDLEKLAGITRGIYEPEQFPAIILRISDPCKASILIFASGKVVIAGLKSSEQLTPTIQRVKDVMKLGK